MNAPLGAAATATLLVADDEPLNLDLIAEFLAGDGYRLVTATDGRQALDALLDPDCAFDAVILDRRMPKLDGIEVLSRIKADPRLRALPVIMQTVAGAVEQVIEGLRHGAYYYLVKPYEPATLATLVRCAVQEHGEQRALLEQVGREREALALLREGRFSLRTLAEARALAATLGGLCPDPASAAMGLAEILVNAVEHGNLGISYREKSALAAAGTWEAEVERRLALPEYAGRRVTVHYARQSGGIVFHVHDEGAGFDWRPFLDISAERAFDPNGRGIALARQLAFSSLEYLHRGNEVRATVALSAEDHTTS